MVLDGGLTVPGGIWKKLFKYAKINLNSLINTIYKTLWRNFDV